jgi:lipopolysaccharide export system permease protein
MTLLDRYIARQYLINAVALLVVLFSFVVTIDAALNFDRMMKTADQMLRADGVNASAIRRLLLSLFLVADLWWPRLLHLFNYTAGLVMVGAMGFTFSQLVRGREFVAVLASGIPLYRVARPVLIIALGVTAIEIANQEIVIPRIAGLLTRDHGDAGKRSLASTRVSPCSDAKGRVLYARSFDPTAGTMDDVWIWERDERAVATRRITATRAVWRDGGWDLTDGKADRGEAKGSQVLPPEPVPRIETDLDPTVLTMRRYEHYRQSLSWSPLGQLLSRPDQLHEGRREQIERIRWGRLSILLSNLLALVVAMPFFLRREPDQNMIFQSLKCAPVSIAALMGGVLGASAVVPGVPPQLGVFIPVLILAPVAIASATSVKT